MDAIHEPVIVKPQGSGACRTHGQGILLFYLHLSPLGWGLQEIWNYEAGDV